mmetsp:Transcript_6885/g.14931  ORF Transcript_6885/g.14931 Transcript_6885/m.14931 type:complete len:201 (+) Transcript_6885:2329-2931(+)
MGRKVSAFSDPATSMDLIAFWDCVWEERGEEAEAVDALMEAVMAARRKEETLNARAPRFLDARGLGPPLDFPSASLFTSLPLLRLGSNRWPRNNSDTTNTPNRNAMKLETLNVRTPHASMAAASYPQMFGLSSHNRSNRRHVRSADQRTTPLPTAYEQETAATETEIICEYFRTSSTNNLLAWSIFLTSSTCPKSMRSKA